MKYANEIRAAVEMVQSRGIQPTLERTVNFTRARWEDRSRRKDFARMGLKGPQVRTILGSKMELMPEKEGLDRDLLLDSIREPVATGHIMSILREDDVVLEVGANIGYYALMEASRCKKIYAIEPHPENVERLKRNIELNGYDNIEVQHAGFGEEDGKLKLYTSELSNWHTAKENPGSPTDFIEVDCHRIDTFAEANETPTFIKMDVEGFELEVLRGAKETLKKIRHLFIELHGSLLNEDEIREVLNNIEESGLKPSLVIQYDRPGMSLIREGSFLEQIKEGDRGTFELFFERP
ncbi:FkbM family methyltransferase [Erythrobacter sp. F6033]|uniref:FkbM family methyltransferase n=1 Tax=Erythrobacter sp. F6033 TaxID=2926401 RepID=UPI001FF64FB0|nr:FkbM family methyltransferase [Erythrobacter sp. F6033]MCK0128885.1 FkbM family methyltransferase [Erythrobacter sp. F6033]